MRLLVISSLKPRSGKVILSSTQYPCAFSAENAPKPAWILRNLKSYIPHSHRGAQRRIIEAARAAKSFRHPPLHTISA
jgi:hypothetical protein